MAYDCKVVLDSIAPSGRRLTTLCLTYPRIVHSEVLTHRDRARNSASSRAIPQAKMVAAIERDPFVPLKWLSEQPGMVGGEEVDDGNAIFAEGAWLHARDQMLSASRELAALGVHKSICNRLTEPWMWITVVMTATEWKNFFRLRCHPDAEQHIQKIAYMTRDAMGASSPREVAAGGWHLPYVTGSPDEEELRTWTAERAVEWARMGGHGEYVSPLELLCHISAARCARVSYLTHEGTRDPARDLELYEKLVRGSGFGHWSPHEHAAMAFADGGHRSGPFRGWQQFRKLQPGECADE